MEEVGACGRRGIFQLLPEVSQVVVKKVVIVGVGA